MGMNLLDIFGSVCVGLCMVSITICTTAAAANIVKDKFNDFRERLKSRKE